MNNELLFKDSFDIKDADGNLVGRVAWALSRPLDRFALRDFYAHCLELGNNIAIDEWGTIVVKFSRTPVIIN